MDWIPEYDGPLAVDYYGRLHPKHSNGTVKFHSPTNVVSEVRDKILEQFDRNTDHRLLVRRIGIVANNTEQDHGFYQLNLFTDYKQIDKERKLQSAVTQIRKQFGANAVFRGINLDQAGTALERNRQIGGHRA